MINQVIINDLSQVFDLIRDQGYKESMDRYRSLCVYRGLPNVAFKLVTSLQRNCKGQKKNLEPALLRNFTKYAAIEDPSIEESVWRQLILGQHHGLPTRLLDWTHSPLVALHFAMTEGNYDDMDKHDCVIWKIDMEELVGLLPDSYKNKLKENSSAVFSVSQIREITNSLSEYDAAMGDKAMAIMEPPSIDPRIVNQYSFFSIIPNGIDDIENFLDKNTNHTIKYVISKDLRWRIRDMLDQLNMSERTVYPGLDGLSKWLGRHYYVK